MGYRRSLSLCIFVLAVSNLVNSANNDALKQLPYTDSQSDTIIDVINKLQARHYRNQHIDDSLSTRFIDKYLESLDPARMFFYADDINALSQDRSKYDDYFKSGNLAPGFKLYHQYRTRVIARLEKVLELIRSDEITFKFDQNDELELDRKASPWPKTEAEADQLWYKRVKLSLLNLKMAGKSVEEARKTVEKRYKNQLNRVRQEDSADVFETLANSLTMLFDPHTNYWSPRTSENFNINMSLSLEGIGAVLQSEDEFTKVVRLVPGGPASKQGQLKSTDRIIGVGQGKNGEIVDVVGWRLDEVVQLIRGKKNTVVRLEVLPAEAAANGTAKTIDIKRGKVKLEDQAAQKATFDVSDGNKIYKIGVIDLPAFYIDFAASSRRDPNFRSSSRDVMKLIDQLKQEKVDGIILDLRNNGGGSLREATILTDLFINQGPVVQIRSPDKPVNRHHRSMSYARYNGPLAVMVNRLSASASEILAGAIQDYKRGIIVGSQSFGKGTVQSVTPLEEGQLKITESKFYRVSGDSTQHRGVIPDIELPILINKEDVGESTYENALPWDKIHSVPHDRYFDYTRLLPELHKRHKTRVAEDPDFNFILDQIDMMQKNKDRKTISLNEKRRLAEKEALELQAMAIENKRRKAKGLETHKTLEAYRKSNSDEDKPASSSVASTTIDIEGDTLLLETGNILADLIKLTSKSNQQHAMNDPSYLKNNTVSPQGPLSRH